MKFAIKNTNIHSSVQQLDRGILRNGLTFESYPPTAYNTSF